MRIRPLVAGAIAALTAAGAATIVITALPAGAAQVPGPALSVDVTADRHAISPDIYGMNHASAELADALNLPVRRWGGNATTRYNYLFDETNRGSDWYFENVPGSADPAQLPDGSETDVFVEQDRDTGAKTILTVPLIGWVPKARDYSCGFSVAEYGPQQQTDAQWRPDCGNGVKPDGSFVTGNDPTDTSVEAGADYVADFLGHLTGKYGTAQSGGVAYYNLDNEPDLWHATHRDVHPAGASYEEIRDRTFLIGAAVKAADPGAKTLGPVGWGWNSLFMSGLDQETCNRLGGSCWSNPPDRAAHGGTPFAAWYLAQLAAYEQQHGQRILDYFDEHIYPQGSGVAFGHGNDPATNALRLRSTRALWDPTYVDESWINTTMAFIPTMKSLVANNYPGTRTAITEYNWGALDHINGALAQADVLGIFGREGLDLATLWAPPSAGQPGAHAFGMYLNYDGAGARFGDTAVRATSADQDKLAVYAAQRSTDGARTVMVVNKTADDLVSSLSIANGTTALGSKAQVWRYSAANLAGIVRAPDVNVAVPPPVYPPGPHAVSTTYPANSITLLVIPGAAPDTQAPSVSAPFASATTPTTLTASWGAGTDNVGITGYQIQLLPGNSGQPGQTVDIPAGTLTHTFTGLLPGKGYGLGLRARDAAGNWSLSIATPNLIVLPALDSSPPTAPGKPVVSGLTSNAATVTWAASTDNVGVARYEVFLVYTDIVYRAGTTTATSLAVTGLTPNMPHTVFVRAFDAAGNSATSPSTAFSTPPAGGSGCQATYRQINSWPGHFQAEVTVRNSGTTSISGWTVRWVYPNGTRIGQLWSGTLLSPGPMVAVANAPWNGSLAPTAATTFGFIGDGPQVAPALTCSPA